MSQLSIILALLFSLVIAVFAIANNQPVVINYLYGSTEISAVVVILVSAFLGALAIFLLSIVRHIKVSLQFRSMRNEIKDLHTKAQSLVEERDDFLTQLGMLQEPHESTDGYGEAVDNSHEKEEETIGKND
ncbi:MAG: LapA family protein [Bacillota bacterium]|nr:LapA family protein [Bacillota bacterium]